MPVAGLLLGFDPMLPQRQPVRPSRTAPPASLGVPEVARPAAGPRPATYELIERITSLQLKMAPLEVLADGVVPSLLDAFSAPAGGLLLYHSEDSSLRLIASRGLSAQGREHLAVLRAGVTGGWEIPLHGLMNRKAYIIERPHEHPFTPELVDRDETRSPTNLACIPLYRGQLPVGVILVIAKMVQAIDAVAKESLFHGWGGGDGSNKQHINGADAVKWSVDRLNVARAAGRPIFVVDYTKNRSATDISVRRIREQGYVPYIGPKELNVLWLPGKNF